MPSPAIAEVGKLFGPGSGPHTESLFRRAVAEGDSVTVEPTVSYFARMAEMVDQYGDLPLGTTDVSEVAFAERLGVTEIATLDRRHFSVVRPRQVSTFSILPG